MSRRTRAKQEMAAAWSGVAHSRIRHDVTDSPAWRVLSFSSKALYVDLRAKLRSTNNGNINATLSEMKHRGWTSPATLSKSLRELETLGFIEKTRQGGIASLARVCSLYRFTDLPTPEWPHLGIKVHKATCDWKRFESVHAAKDELRGMSEQKNKSKLQKLKHKATKTVPMRPAKATEIEQGARTKLQKLKLAEYANG